MSGDLKSYVETLHLSNNQKVEVLQFLEENDYEDIVDDAIKRISENRGHLSQSKIIGLDNGRWFITNGNSGAIHLSDRAYFTKEELLLTLSGAKPCLSKLEDQ